MFSWTNIYIEKFEDGHWVLAEPAWVDDIPGTVEKIESPEWFRHDFVDCDIFKNMIYGQVKDVRMAESFLFTDGPRDIPKDASDVIKKVRSHEYFEPFFAWTWFSLEELLDFDWEKQIHRYIHIPKAILNTLPGTISCEELKKIKTPEIYFGSGHPDPEHADDYEKRSCTMPLAEFIGRDLLQSFFDELLKYGTKDKVRLICHLEG